MAVAISAHLFQRIFLTDHRAGFACTAHLGALGRDIAISMGENDMIFVHLKQNANEGHIHQAAGDAVADHVTRFEGRFIKIEFKGALLFPGLDHFFHLLHLYSAAPGGIIGTVLRANLAHARCVNKLSG